LVPLAYFPGIPCSLILKVIGGGLFGFDVSSLSAFLSTPQYKDYFNSPGDVLQGGITASMSAGSLIGAIIAGFLSDRFGRRHAVQIAALIWLVGSSICSASQNVPMLIVGR
jgi:MFS family permease